jgi:hypothetical protein
MPRPVAVTLLAAAMFAVVAIVAAIAGGISWAIPIVLVALIAGAWALANMLLGRRTLARHHDSHQEAVRDADEGGLPKAHVVGDDRTPLGDTPEVHAEVSPHDFPKGAPERKAAERMAEEEPGGHDGETTRGHEDPSRREGRIRRPAQSRRG